MKIKHTKIIIIATTLLATCSAQKESSGLNGIIGSNDLTKTTENSHIQGLLSTTAGRDCNAFLIAPNLIATTLHCVGEDPQSFIGYKFKPINGVASAIVDSSYSDDSKDMIVYYTQSTYKHFYVLGKVDLSSPARIVAFDHDSSSLVTEECAISKENSKDGIIAHTCDTKPKFSGSPILQGGKVVGMHIGFNPKKNLNYAFNLDDMFNDQVDLSSLEISIQLEWPHVRSPHVRSPHIRSEHIRAPSLQCVAFVTSTDYYQFKAMVTEAKRQGVIHNRHECMGGSGPGSSVISIVAFAQHWTLGAGSMISYLATNGAKCACEEVFSN